MFYKKKERERGKYKASGQQEDMEARKTRDLLQYFVVADKREIYRFLLAPGTGFYEHIEIYFTHLAEVLWLIAHLSCCILWD